MFAQLMIAAALLVQQSPEEADKTEQQLIGYARMERFAAAKVRIEECSKWGYEPGTGVLDEVLDTWRRYLQPNGVTFEQAIERHNAQVDRLRQEAVEEQEFATTSRQAFTIYKRLFNQRCDALAYDRPNWLKTQPMGFAIATMGWNAVADEEFGPEPKAED